MFDHLKSKMSARGCASQRLPRMLFCCVLILTPWILGAPLCEGTWDVFVCDGGARGGGGQNLHFCAFHQQTCVGPTQSDLEQWRFDVYVKI